MIQTKNKNRLKTTKPPAKSKTNPLGSSWRKVGHQVPPREISTLKWTSDHVLERSLWLLCEDKVIGRQKWEQGDLHWNPETVQMPEGDRGKGWFLISWSSHLRWGRLPCDRATEVWWDVCTKRGKQRCGWNTQERRVSAALGTLIQKWCPSCLTGWVRMKSSSYPKPTPESVETWRWWSVLTQDPDRINLAGGGKEHWVPAAKGLRKVGWNVTSLSHRKETAPITLF